MTSKSTERNLIDNFNRFSQQLSNVKISREDVDQAEKALRGLKLDVWDEKVKSQPDKRTGS